jgi:hypothetical protein
VPAAVCGEALRPPQYLPALLYGPYRRLLTAPTPQSAHRIAPFASGRKDSGAALSNKQRIALYLVGSGSWCW